MQFDVIVIGGGHAGNEAAHIAARLGSKTLLVTLSVEKIGWMPCNPAIGGIGKGHIVHEIAALNGLMPQLCTKNYLQARMLNTRKGPAVQGLRLQIDKITYNQSAKESLLQTPNLTVLAACVDEVLVENKKVIGIKTQDGTSYYASCVVLTTGTFLNGVIHCGGVRQMGGRVGEESVSGLGNWLRGCNFAVGRLKTGTPPRLAKHSIDIASMESQGSHDLDYLFEYSAHKTVHKADCYITYTNERTHKIIRDNAHLSPMAQGQITGKPPRYCPSIEDKVVRFASKTAHHVFVEPESLYLDEWYPNGISTSLPLEVQQAYIRSIKGFEQAEIVKPGYAIEYDYVDPRQLDHTLAVKGYEGLFLAGQINGTTGYEEAAGQGIVAGINAHQKAHRLDRFILDRSNSYIGVMIDDLVTLGADEPYRMFTSRSERRLITRQDNVFTRLADQAYAYQLIDGARYTDIMASKAKIMSVVATITTDPVCYKAVAQATGRNDDALVYQAIDDACLVTHGIGKLNARERLSAYAELLYGPYLEREEREIQKMAFYKELSIPETFSYADIPGLSRELESKLRIARPATIAQIMQIPGITPAALSLLIFKVRLHQQRQGASA